MEKDKKIAVVSFVEHSDGGVGWTGRDAEGEPRRKRVLCHNMPEVIHWLFEGTDVAELERLVYAWAGEGGGTVFSAKGRFLKKNEAWLEDLEIRLQDMVSGMTWDYEIGEVDRVYAEDVLGYLGIGRG